MSADAGQGEAGKFPDLDVTRLCVMLLVGTEKYQWWLLLDKVPKVQGARLGGRARRVAERH